MTPPPTPPSSPVHLLPTLPPPFLAQAGFGIIDPPVPPPLPQPPFFEHYLFENPWPLLVLLIVGAAVCFLRFRALGKTRVALITAACLLLAAAGEWLLAASIQTGREAIERNTRSLVAAAATVNLPALGTLLSEELSLYRPGAGGSLGKAETIDRVQQTLGGVYKISEWAVLETQSMTDAPGAGVTQSRIRVTLEAGFPNISWWKIDWRKGPDGAWRAVTIEPVSVTPEVRGQLR